MSRIIDEMNAERSNERIRAYRELVGRLLAGPPPAGETFDACRAVLTSELDSDSAFTALVALLEGALAEPSLPIDDAQLVVPMIRAVGRGELTPAELVGDG